MNSERMKEPPFQWSHKGSDTALVFIGTPDDFKIHGVPLMELHDFCNEHLFMGMIRSIPLFRKPNKATNPICNFCSFYKKGGRDFVDVNGESCHHGDCPSAGGFFLKVD